MNTTYLNLVSGEKRYVELVIRDSNEMPYLPTIATAYFRDRDEDTLEELSCSLDANVVTVLVEAPLIAGNYSILWQITNGDENVYHETKITLLEI